MRVKSSGVAPGLANARPPGSAKFANTPPPGLKKASKCPIVSGEAGRSWNWSMPHNHQYLNTETLKSCLFKKLKEGTKRKNERYTTDIPIPFLYFFLSRGGGEGLNLGAEHQIILSAQNKEAVVFKTHVLIPSFQGMNSTIFSKLARFTVDCKTRFLSTFSRHRWHNLRRPITFKNLQINGEHFCRRQTL